MTSSKSQGGPLRTSRRGLGPGNHSVTQTASEVWTETEGYEETQGHRVPLRQQRLCVLSHNNVSAPDNNSSLCDTCCVSLLPLSRTYQKSGSPEMFFSCEQHRVSQNTEPQGQSFPHRTKEFRGNKKERGQWCHKTLRGCLLWTLLTQKSLRIGAQSWELVTHWVTAAGPPVKTGTKEQVQSKPMRHTHCLVFVLVV